MNGRAFEVRELTRDERKAICRKAGVGDLDKLDVIDAAAPGLGLEEALAERMNLGAEYDATAVGVGRVLDGVANRHSIRPALLADLMTALDSEA